MADESYKVPENPIYKTEIRKIADEDPVSASEILNPVLAQMIENTAAVKRLAEESGGDSSQMYIEEDGCVDIPSVYSYTDMENKLYTIMPTSNFQESWPFEKKDTDSDFGRGGGVTTHACISPDQEFIYFGGPVQEGAPTLSAVKVNGSLSDYETVSLFEESELPGTVTDMAVSSDGRLLVVTHDKNPALTEGDEHLCFSMYLKNESGTFSRIADPLSEETAMNGPRLARTSSVKFQPGGSLFVVTCVPESSTQPCTASIYRYDNETGLVSYVKDLFDNSWGACDCDWSNDGKYIVLVAAINNYGAPHVFLVEDDGTNIATRIIWTRGTSGGSLYTVKFIPDSDPAAFICVGTEQWWGSPYFYIEEAWEEVVEHRDSWTWSASILHEFPNLSNSLYYPKIIFTKSENDGELYAVVTHPDHRPSLHKYFKDSGTFQQEAFPNSKLSSKLYCMLSFADKEVLALPSTEKVGNSNPEIYRYSEYYPTLNVNNLGELPLHKLQNGDIKAWVPFTITYGLWGQDGFFMHNPSNHGLYNELEKMKASQELFAGAYERTRLHAENDYTVKIPQIQSYDELIDAPYNVVPTSLQNDRFPWVDKDNTPDFGRSELVTYSPAFSPDGAHLILCGNYTGVLNAYRVISSTEYEMIEDAFAEEELPANKVNMSAFTHDSKFLFLAHNSGSYFTIFKRDGDRYTKIEDPLGIARTQNSQSVKVSPDGKFVCVTTIRGTSNPSQYRAVLYAYDEETETISVHKVLSDESVLPNLRSYSDVKSCDWSVDGKYLVLGESYGIYVFERTAEDDFIVLENHFEDATYYCYDVVFAPTTEGYYIGTCNTTSPLSSAFLITDRGVELWQNSGWSGIGSYGQSGPQPKTLKTPDNQWIIAMGGTYPRMYQFKENKFTYRSSYRPISFSATTGAFSPDGAVAILTGDYVNRPPRLFTFEKELAQKQLDVNGLGEKPLVLLQEGAIEEGVPITIAYDKKKDALLVHNPSLSSYCAGLRRDLDILKESLQPTVKSQSSFIKELQEALEALTMGFEFLAPRIDELETNVKILDEEVAEIKTILQVYRIEEE